FDATGAQVDAVTTGADGSYAFFNREPGVYTVRLLGVPDGQSQTSPRGNFTYTVSLADGSNSPGNAATDKDFGLTGRKPSVRAGLYVSAGDVDGDGFADIITGTSPGGGPRVTVFGGRTGQQIADFFAYDPEFRGGVRVGAADVNADGRAEVLTGPGVNKD